MGGYKTKAQWRHNGVAAGKHGRVTSLRCDKEKVDCSLQG